MWLIQIRQENTFQVQVGVFLGNIEFLKVRLCFIMIAGRGHGCSSHFNGVVSVSLRADCVEWSSGISISTLLFCSLSRRSTAPLHVFLILS
jgi:hypothetical protein